MSKHTLPPIPWSAPSVAGRSVVKTFTHAQLLAIGAALYAANEAEMEDVGIHPEVIAASQGAFDAVDHFLTEVLGADWVLAAHTPEAAAEIIREETEEVPQWEPEDDIPLPAFVSAKQARSGGKL